MPGFNWTTSRLDRLRAAVRAFNAAITRKAKEYEDMGMGELSQYLPARAVVSEVRGRIHSVNDFRRIVGYKNDLRRGRTSELTRVLKSARPDALDVVVGSDGVPVTKYEQREYANNKRAIERARRMTEAAMGTEMFEGDTAYDLGDMSPEQYATVTSDNDVLPPDAGEYDDSVEDVDAETLSRWRREDARNKRSQVTVDAMYDVYMDTWTNPLNFHSAMPGYQALIDAMDWMAENRAEALNKMFASGVDELDPQYITESGGASNPYVNIPYETRHNRAVNYAVRAARSLGMQGVTI